ncbi:relaxase/mobilization nuclease domain-containing protein [Massilia sp. CCM 9210]|uniref:relaxase/mobilization nuclease domain-containing protein n=1 Tax=Massilia scottii TaxID=3057166 RepID=UPI002796BF7A|nr:relaxase/mobilization nuclease domain-containing protein [Massilia sp. CCM 9210]MDQ1817756.1 relaxase/mobilization nuclease domain-containing protein [Massilia sp. CCM 9210]
MSSFDSIDSWFEKGFRVRQQKAASTQGAKRDRVRSGGGSGPASRGGAKFSAGAKAKNIKSVIRKAPEVMVKITGSSKGMKTVKNHLEYISRNGQVELVDETGHSIKGLAEVRGLREQLKASQIPDEGKKREFLHVMFSMPPGTSEKAVRDAVAQFCQEEFSNRRYVMAQHHDTDHSHVHVCVSTRDIDRADEARLSPRKDDLFRWRQGFADKLREQGVDAAASERRHRFNHKKAEHPVVRQIRADNPTSAVYDADRAQAKLEKRALRAATAPAKAFVGPYPAPRVPDVYLKLKNELDGAVATNKRPANPAHEKIERNRQVHLAGWDKVASSLEKSGDRELAAEVRELMQAGRSEPISRNQALFDVQTGRVGKEAAKDDIELDR